MGHPLLELDEELLDAMNYCAEAKRQGWNLDSTASLLRVLRETVKRTYEGST